jgi:SAM-dependent methyltransferase
MNADYGIDAPNVIRNLAIGGGIALLLGIAALVGWLPPVLVARVGSIDLRFPILGPGFGVGIGLLTGAAWMYFGARYGKISSREKLLDRISWRGDERVLDIGCGRGLLLVGAAKRVPRGSAVGIDIWQAEDLSGNRSDVPLENAVIEGVRDRVSVETADMRKLPFPDASFDVVVSRVAIHNLYVAPDRAAAIREIARVLRPAGRAVIQDIRHMPEYTREFHAHGCRDVRLLDSQFMSLLTMVATMGSLRPNTMLVRKD